MTDPTPTAPQDALTLLREILAWEESEILIEDLFDMILPRLRAYVESTPPVTQAASAEGESVGMEVRLVAGSLEAVLPLLRDIQAHCGPGDHDEIIARAVENLAAYHKVATSAAASQEMVSKLIADARRYGVTLGIDDGYDRSGAANDLQLTIDRLERALLRPSDGWNRDMSKAPRGRKLIAGYYNRAGNWRSVMARYYLKGTLEMSDQSDSDDEWAPEGWYEEGDADAYAENLQPIEREPVAWMYLAAPPSPEAGRE